MCLTLRSRSKQPYKTGWTEKNIRYKMIDVVNGIYKTPYMDSVYDKKEWNKAITYDINPSPRHFGFHVFVSKAEAIDFCSLFGPTRAICEVEVKGFLRSGRWTRRRSETYKQIKFKSIVYRETS